MRINFVLLTAIIVHRLLLVSLYRSIAKMQYGDEKKTFQVRTSRTSFHYCYEEKELYLRCRRKKGQLRVCYI